MPLNTINRLLHNPLLWIWCVCVLALLLLGQRLTTRTLRLHKLLVSEEGASYSLNLALVTPLYTFMICFLVELTLLLNVQMGLDYAAYSAARSAIVWLPAENTPRNTPQQFRNMVHLAAAQAMTPYASSLKDHVRSDGTNDSAGEEAYLSAYRDLVTTGDRQTARYVVAKRRYAMAATSVEFDPSPTAVLNPSSSPDKLLTVRVRYEMPFNIPGIGRILGRRSTSGPGYVRDLVSTVTLEVERPRSKTGRLDWEYDSRPASHQSSSGQSGTGQSGTGQSGTGQSGTGQSGTGQSGTGQSGTGQSGTGQSGTGQSGTGQSGTGQSGTGCCGGNGSNTDECGITADQLGIDCDVADPYEDGKWVNLSVWSGEEAYETRVHGFLVRIFVADWQSGSGQTGPGGVYIPDGDWGGTIYLRRDLDFVDIRRVLSHEKIHADQDAIDGLMDGKKSAAFGGIRRRITDLEAEAEAYRYQWVPDEKLADRLSEAAKHIRNAESGDCEGRLRQYRAALAIGNTTLTRAYIEMAICQKLSGK